MNTKTPQLTLRIFFLFASYPTTSSCLSKNIKERWKKMNKLHCFRVAPKKFPGLKGNVAYGGLEFVNVDSIFKGHVHGIFGGSIHEPYSIANSMTYSKPMDCIHWPSFFNSLKVNVEYPWGSRDVLHQLFPHIKSLRSARAHRILQKVQTGPRNPHLGRYAKALIRRERKPQEK